MTLSQIRGFIIVATVLCYAVAFFVLCLPFVHLVQPLHAPRRLKVSTGYSHVDPLIGTINGGHVFPGASLPFGMAKAVADVSGENQGGYGSDGSSIIGFSHMHDSGTGWMPSFGNFPIFPHAGCPNDSVDECRFTKDYRAVSQVNGSVEARPGYFAVTLDTATRAEMTVTNHTALYRFTFAEPPAGANATLSPMILSELSDLPKTISASSSAIEVDPLTGRIQGNGTFSPSFGTGSYDLYFCADFSGAGIREVGVFVDNDTPTIIPPDSNKTLDFKPRGAFTRFRALPPGSEILARVGLSFISNEQACRNGETEIPTFDFDSVLLAAEAAWRSKLSAIEINAGGTSHEMQTTFWSSIYRSLLSPQDYTGENPLWNSSEPYYDSWYCIWDSFRSLHPLITLIDPVSQTRMVRSLIDIYVHEGKLPDCRMSLCKGFTQGGSNADIVLADAFLKNMTEGVNWTLAYEAVVSDAEEQPKNWNTEGRGGVQDWIDYGYIPFDESLVPDSFGMYTRSVSRTVEYAYDDFCIAEMARGLGLSRDYDKYMNRSSNWKNLFRVDQTSFLNITDSSGVPLVTDTGFTGFLQPRLKNGSWAAQDPAFCSPVMEPNACFLDARGGETYEGPIWLYTFFVPGDMASLISYMGGPETFVERLDYLHDSGVLYFGDEQSFLTAFLYHYAGRPGLTAKRIHDYIPSQFNASVNGIPGNDDSGAMGAFAGLSMMGIFPNPGQNVYFITPPFFREISITNQLSGKTATIRNINFDPEYKNIFIQKAYLDGAEYSRNWLEHSFFVNGGTLELVLGSEESRWGTREEDGPPSLSTTGPVGGLRDEAAA